MIERLTQDEAADAIAVCTGAARGLTNVLRFALQMKQHKDLVSSRKLQSHLGDYPFTNNNFLWQGNIYDLSYFWATGCDVLPLKSVRQLPQELQVQVKTNLNDLAQRGYLKLTPDGYALQLTADGKQLAYSPEFIEKSVQSTQTTILQVQKYLEQQYGMKSGAPTATYQIGNQAVATGGTTSVQTTANSIIATAGKSAVQNGAQTAAKVTTQTAVAGASSAGIGAVVSIAAEAAKSGFKSISNLVIK